MVEIWAGRFLSGNGHNLHCPEIRRRVRRSADLLSEPPAFVFVVDADSSTSRSCIAGESKEWQ
jgi:hypothetical protein